MFSVLPRCTAHGSGPYRIAKNLCQAPGTGLYLDVHKDSPSREITLLYAMWDVTMYSKVLGKRYSKWVEVRVDISAHVGWKGVGGGDSI
jgi:hypothetical protein